jgi:hypothetical protein
MRANLELIGATLVAPAVVALFVAWISRRLLPEHAATRYRLALGLASGFAAGYVLLPEWAPLVPTRHWQWLPYLAMAAAVVGPVGCASGVAAWERLLLACALAFAAAWFLVPTWETLQPPRAALMPAVAAYLLALAGLLSMLPDRLLGATFISVLAASAMATAVCVAIATSFKYGQVTVLAASALAGCWLAAALWNHRESTAASSRSIAAAYAVLVGGMAFVGGVELEPPDPWLLLAPAAPLLLWVFAPAALERFQGWKLTCMQWGSVLTLLAAAVGWAAVGR